MSVLEDPPNFQPLRHDKLPPPPPPDDRESVLLPPPPPPKLLEVDLGTPLSTDSLSPSSSHDNGLVVPLTPTTPISPTSPNSDARPKKTNPLTDLIDTEKPYVDYLTGIIRKVAAAWSRSNLPPPELDIMFRSIEGVYKANRALGSKLKEVGKNPSNPAALGDLLMRWIDDLEGPYTNYATKYSTGFDFWVPVQSNAKLPSVLAAFSESNPPISPDTPIWTLDALFLLPKLRIKYYRKLYGRLLKNTGPGQSQHRLLVRAVDKLDKLLDILEEREKIVIGNPRPSSPPTALTEQESEDVVVVKPSTGRNSELSQDMQSLNLRVRSSDPQPSSASSSARGSSSSTSGGERSSRDTANTSVSRGSSATMSSPITDLERRLATQRTLDIFTMQPKVVRLQISPPSLTYTREMRLSVDIVISVTPRATGVEVIHRQGHIFLLSDLFLVCERMTAEERAEGGSDGPDMWLLYPPLAGKVLRVSEIPERENAIQISIMRKENIILHADSDNLRALLLKQFRECIEFAGSVPPVSKQPPPPVPPLNGFSANGLTQSPSSRTDSLSPPVSRVASPSILAGRPPVSSVEDTGSEGRYGVPRPLGPGQIMAPQPGHIFPAQGGMSLGPGQGLPSIPAIHRNPSIQSSMAPQPPQPGQIMPGQIIQRAPSVQSISPGQVMRNTSVTSYNEPRRVSPNQGPSQTPPSSFHPPSNIPSPPGPFMGSQPGSGPVGSGQMPPYAAPDSFQNGMRKSPSVRSLNAQYENPLPPPPPPAVPQHLPPHPGPNQHIPRVSSNPQLATAQLRPMLPSSQYNTRVMSAAPSFADPSPPGSPEVETSRLPSGPVTTTVSAQMKCKVFLKQHHAVWKSLGTAKLKLYRQDPTNIKQLVVEADNKDKSVLISTIVLTDGVERVGKTGVAIELSDQGARTGVVYMIQLRNENSAGGLFDSLLAGSDRYLGK